MLTWVAAATETWPKREPERSLKPRYATTTSATPVATAMLDDGGRRHRNRRAHLRKRGRHLHITPDDADSDQIETPATHRGHQATGQVLPDREVVRTSAEFAQHHRDGTETEIFTADGFGGGQSGQPGLGSGRPCAGTSTFVEDVSQNLSDLVSQLVHDLPFRPPFL